MLGLLTEDVARVPIRTVNSREIRVVALVMVSMSLNGSGTVGLDVFQWSCQTAQCHRA